MKFGYLYFAVFIAGAAVLAIEILGTRILGPYYGVNLFLWSALISVTLIALSGGYMLGGRWADRGPQMKRLCFLLIGAGLWLLLLPIIKEPLLGLAEPLGLRLAVLTAAFFLFAPPLTLLGMVSPYAIKLRATHMGEVGRTAGDLYALSTIGSVLSALLTGFVLIPHIGISRLTLAIGAMLLFTASLGLLLERKGRFPVLISGGLSLLCFGAYWLTPPEGSGQVEGLLAFEQSPYAELRVVDADDRRYLLIDGGTHTIADPETWASYFPYVAVIDMTREFFPQPGKLLLVGLGGGSLMKRFAKENWEVTGVEIDEKVITLARQYFGLQPSDGDVYSQDGRQFLLTHPTRYDLIVMDAFGSSSIPFHLITEEAFGLIASRLNERGVLAINLESRAWNDRLVRAMAATLEKQFAHVWALPAHKNPEELGNMVLLAANRPLARSREPRYQSWEVPSREYLKSKAYLQDFAWQNRFEPETREAPVLTDDLNPVDLWAEAINLEARKKLHRYFESTEAYD